SVRSKTNDLTLGASVSVDRITMSKVSGVTTSCSHGFGFRRRTERVELVGIADLDAREISERVLHAEERIAEVVPRHAALVARADEIGDERRRVGRVKDDTG